MMGIYDDFHVIAGTYFRKPLPIVPNILAFVCIEILLGDSFHDALHGYQPDPVRVISPYMGVYAVVYAVKGESQWVVFHCNLFRECWTG